MKTTAREERAIVLKVVIVGLVTLILFPLLLSWPSVFPQRPTVGNMDVGLKVWLSHEEDAKRESVPGPFTVSKRASVQVRRPETPPLSSGEWQIMVEKVNETEVRVSYHCCGSWNERKGMIVE